MFSCVIPPTPDIVTLSPDLKLWPVKVNTTGFAWVAPVTVFVFVEVVAISVWAAVIPPVVVTVAAPTVLAPVITASPDSPCIPSPSTSDKLLTLLIE